MLPTQSSSLQPSRRSLVAWAPLVLVLVLALVAVAALWRGSSVPASLLRGRLPAAAPGVSAPAQLTDDAIAREGDDWSGPAASRFQRPRASVLYDLGQVQPLHAAYVQADDNDSFVLEASLDGQRFFPVWTVSEVGGGGLRERFTSKLDASARYLRLTNTSADRYVSVSELQVFSVVPRPWPPRPRIGRGSSEVHRAVEALVGFGALAVLLLLLHDRRWPWPARLLATLVVLGVGAYAGLSVARLADAPQPVVDVLRAVAAIVSAAAVARSVLRPEHEDGKTMGGALLLMGLAALLAFYNLGSPQFSHVAAGRRTYVHTWDMRVYFPIAKYFDELAFDGLYVASVAAYLEDTPGASVERIASVPLRDLDTYQMTTVAECLPAIQAIRHRFTPERWRDFKHDMKFFRETMGDGYLASLRDHGGNATPVWLLVARLLFRSAEANETTLLAAALLDPALLLLFFGVAARCFGLRTAALCLVVYGTSTFPWFGSNWAGSTLRNDWMVLLGLGICALATRRWATGGALLAGAALARAFPVLAVLFLVAPAGWWLADTWRAEGQRPSWQRLRTELDPLLRAAAGAALCVALLGGLSAASLGVHKGWVGWVEKISRHSTKPNINHVGWRTVVAYDSSTTLAALHAQPSRDWSVEHLRNLRRRRGLYTAGVLLFSALALLACRGRSLAFAAAVGIMMVPIWLYPSNYYLHFVFVLPLLGGLAAGPRARWWWGWVAVVLLAMSYVEYFGFRSIGVDERYAEWSWSALVGFTLLLCPAAWRGWRADAAPRSEGRAALRDARELTLPSLMRR